MCIIQPTENANGLISVHELVVRVSQCYVHKMTNKQTVIRRESAQISCVIADDCIRLGPITSDSPQSPARYINEQSLTQEVAQLLRVHYFTCESDGIHKYVGYLTPNNNDGSTVKSTKWRSIRPRHFITSQTLRRLSVQNDKYPGCSLHHSGMMHKLLIKANWWLGSVQWTHSSITS